MIDTPEARALRPRHYGANNSNLQHGRGRLFAKSVPYDAPEKPGVEYLPKHDTSLDRESDCGFVNVDFLTEDWTTDMGATQLIRGSHLWPLSELPKLEDEEKRHEELKVQFIDTKIEMEERIQDLMDEIAQLMASARVS